MFFFNMISPILGDLKCFSETPQLLQDIQICRISIHMLNYNLEKSAETKYS